MHLHLDTEGTHTHTVSLKSNKQFVLGMNGQTITSARGGALRELPSNSNNGGPSSSSPFRFAASPIFHNLFRSDGGGSGSTDRFHPFARNRTNRNGDEHNGDGEDECGGDDEKEDDWARAVITAPDYFIKPYPASPSAVASSSCDVLCHLEERQRRRQQQQQRQQGRRGRASDDQQEEGHTDTTKTTAGASGCSPASPLAKRQRLAHGTGTDTGHHHHIGNTRSRPPRPEDISGVSSILDTSLASRIAENESLLDDLLFLGGSGGGALDAVAEMRGRNEPTPSGSNGDQQRRHTLNTASAAAAVGIAPATPTTAGLSVRELRALCTEAGLLTCGTKAELQQRLSHHHARVSATATAMQDARPPSPAPQRPAPGDGHPTNNAINETNNSNDKSPSPHRTVFRYCSNSNSNAAPPPPPAALQPKRPQGRRLVPSPTAFIEAFIATHKEKERERTSASSLRPLPLPLPLLPSVVGAWQLLVDNREKVQGRHEAMLEALAKQQVPCSSCALPCGDFMINVRLNDDHDTPTITPTTPTITPTITTSDATALYPHLLSVVVERKTLADLDSSIKGSRYIEQRRLLARCPFTRVLWLIEGTEEGGTTTITTSTSSSSGGGGGVYYHRGATTNGSASAHHNSGGELQVRVTSACASLSFERSFRVVRTRTVQESIAFLRQLAETATTTTTTTATAAAAARLPTVPSSSTSATATATALSSPAASSLVLLPTAATLAATQRLQKRLRAMTALPRMLMCVRGCSAGLALFLVRKFGSLHRLWAWLRERGTDACDNDEEIRRLSLAQRKVVVVLSEFVIASEYF